MRLEKDNILYGSRVKTQILDYEFERKKKRKKYFIGKERGNLCRFFIHITFDSVIVSKLLK